jgi:adenosylcobyric acid synthase
MDARAEEAGICAEGILDYSANLNPEGPPEWLSEAAEAALARIGHYPAPDSRRACRAASERYKLAPERFLFGNGADDLLGVLSRALGAKAALVFSPTYSGYIRSCQTAGVPVEIVPLAEAEDFRLDPAVLRSSLSRLPKPGIVFLGRPNNPAGAPLSVDDVIDAARAFPDHFLCADESFVELAEGVEPLLAPGKRLPDNLIVLRSLTKTLAVPGARIGFLAATPGIVQAARSQMQSWPVNCLAEEIAIRSFSDARCLTDSAACITGYRARYASRLASIPGVRPLPGFANFLLLSVFGTDARAVADAALRRGVAFRTYGPGEGLDGSRFLRSAVRGDEENENAAQVLEAAVRAVREASL